MSKYKISIVSYSNTIPMVYGIENSSQLLKSIELFKDVPSECARKLCDGEVDLALMPVAMIPQIQNHQIITDFCIGAVSTVLSVELLSDCPIADIKRIFIDPDSRSSNMLTRLLCEKYWHINPEFCKRVSHTQFELKSGEAAVFIGDYAITATANYKFDLADEWIAYTSMPFVFACWVSNRALEKSFIDDLNQALMMGIQQVDLAIEATHKTFTFDIKSYLTKNINYHLDDVKRRALDLFLDYASTHNSLLNI